MPSSSAGGSPGVTAARELTLAGLDCTLIEARDRLGGRTWYTRLGRRRHRARRRLGALAPAARLGRADARRPGHRQERCGRAGLVEGRGRAAHRLGRAIATRSPCAPGTASSRRRRGAAAPARSALRDRRAGAVRRADDRAADRRARLDAEERDVIAAELEGSRTASSTTPAPSASCAGTRSRARASSSAGDGRRLHVRAGTRGLIDAMAAQAPFAQWLSTPVDSVGRVSDGVEVRTRNGDVLRARSVRADGAAQRPAAHPLRRRSRRPSARPSRSARRRGASSSG